MALTSSKFSDSSSELTPGFSHATYMKSGIQIMDILDCRSKRSLVGAETGTQNCSAGARRERSEKPVVLDFSSQRKPA